MTAMASSSYHHRYSQPSSQSQAQVLETEFPLMGLPPITNPGAQRISRSSSRDRAGFQNSSSLGRQNSNTGQNNSSFGVGRKVSNVSSTTSYPSPPAIPPSYSASATAAPEWQYEAVSAASASAGGRGNGSMSRIQTSFQPSPQRPITVKMGGVPAAQGAAGGGRTTSLNRSSSLRRAYSDACSSSSGEGPEAVIDTTDIGGGGGRLPSPDEVNDESEPLNPKIAKHHRGGGSSRLPHIVQQQSSSGGDGSATSDYHSDSVTVGMKSPNDTTNSDTRDYQESAKQLLGMHHSHPHPDNFHSLRIQGGQQFRY